MLRRALRQAHVSRRRSSSDAVTHRPSRTNRRAYLAGLRDRRDALEAAHGAPALRVATAVERTPVVMPDPDQWELDMWELQARLEEYEGFDYPPSVMNAGGQRGVPQERTGPPKTIPPELLALANRETDADRADDRKSLERRLADSLYLLVKSDGAWALPGVALEDDDESVREAALRALDEHCGKELYTYVLGAAPVAAWDTDAGGFRREFVAKAIVVDPYATGPPACADYVWAAKDELGAYLNDDAYLEFLRKLL
jgi:hypothetical protein